jgi:hypothetical protein
LDYAVDGYANYEARQVFAVSYTAARAVDGTETMTAPACVTDMV